jgi:2'-5' RNA ligase
MTLAALLTAVIIRGVGEKTYSTAAVIIPPDEMCEPIQAIRRVHDRHVRRWMPHVTLVYPFRPRSQFDALQGPLEQACQRIEPFELTLARLGHFHHDRGSFTIWLDPEPNESVRALQTALQSVVPDCDEQSSYASRFTPHLSVGQVRGEDNLQRLLDALQRDWRPITWTVREVALISRGDHPPDDVFRVGTTVSLPVRGR